MNVRRMIGAALAVAAVTASIGVGAQALSNGVGVSGHWVIQVMNPDGTVASRTEFRNHLTADGAALLARTVMRSASLGDWSVGVDGVRADGRPTGFTLNENTPQQLLTVSPGPSGTMRLTGEARMVASTDLLTVATSVKECAAGQSPAVCARQQTPGFRRSFTALTLPNPIRVAANQSVQVQVDIGFTAVQ